jgi:hypothetical protein
MASRRAAFWRRSSAFPSLLLGLTLAMGGVDEFRGAMGLEEGGVEDMDWEEGGSLAKMAFKGTLMGSDGGGGFELMATRGKGEEEEGDVGDCEWDCGGGGGEWMTMEWPPGKNPGTALPAKRAGESNGSWAALLLVGDSLLGRRWPLFLLAGGRGAIINAGQVFTGQVVVVVIAVVNGGMHIKWWHLEPIKYLFR